MCTLYYFRDHYFENHDLNNSINRNRDIEVELQETLALFTKYKGSLGIPYFERLFLIYIILFYNGPNFLDCIENPVRAKYYYLRGRALNVVPRYSKEAEDLLSKAIKLDPKLVEAWNELGECYWKNDNLKEATNCFNKALLYVS